MSEEDREDERGRRRKRWQGTGFVLGKTVRREETKDRAEKENKDLTLQSLNIPHPLRLQHASIQSQAKIPSKGHEIPSRSHGQMTSISSSLSSRYPSCI
jgi:hypothetical protein